MTILFFKVFLLIAHVFADIDVEDQIRMAEDPDFLSYVKEREQAERKESQIAEEFRQQRRRDEIAEEKSRREYVVWRDQQKPYDDSKDEAEWLRQTHREELTYAQAEREHADLRHQEERRVLAHQDRIRQMNRSPASLSMPPRVDRKKRRFLENGSKLQLVKEPLIQN